MFEHLNSAHVGGNLIPYLPIFPQQEVNTQKQWKFEDNLHTVN